MWAQLVFILFEESFHWDLHVCVRQRDGDTERKKENENEWRIRMKKKKRNNNEEEPPKATDEVNATVRKGSKRWRCYKIKYNFSIRHKCRLRRIVPVTRCRVRGLCRFRIHIHIYYIHMQIVWCMQIFIAVGKRQRRRHISLGMLA